MALADGDWRQEGFTKEGLLGEPSTVRSGWETLLMKGSMAMVPSGTVSPSVCPQGLCVLMRAVPEPGQAAAS